MGGMYYLYIYNIIFPLMCVIQVFALYTRWPKYVEVGPGMVTYISRCRRHTLRAQDIQYIRLRPSSLCYFPLCEDGMCGTRRTTQTSVGPLLIIKSFSFSSHILFNPKDSVAIMQALQANLPGVVFK